MQAKRDEILLVEDEDDHADLILRAFRDQERPSRLSVARSLQQAREQLTDSVPALVIADLGLPDGCGADLLVSEKLTSQCPVVILTAHGNETAAVDALKSGAWDYIVKSESTLRDMPHIAGNAIRQWCRREERRLLDDGMRRMEECVAGATSDAFFKSLVDILIDILGVDLAFVAAVRPDGRHGLDEIAVSHRVSDDGDLCHELSGTVCETVARREPCCVAEGVCEQFPQDRLLARWRAEGCAGVPLVDSRNRVSGVLMVVSREPLDRPELISSLLNVSAVRASAELERQRLDAARQRIDERLLERERIERRRIESELEKVKTEVVRSARMAALGEAAAQIAHELRNPLGAVRNAAYFLRTSDYDACEWDEYLSIIDAEVARCDATIRSFLDATRSKDVVRQTVDLGSLVRSEFLHLDCPGNVQCRFKSDIEPFVIQVDPIQWRQVVSNLLANSRDAVGASGSIEVVARRDGDVDVITFCDSGVGVASEHRKMIFELLFTTKASGAGIGLTICQQVVQRHDGMLTLEEAEGGRTTFVIRLPRDGDG